jgi:hypothetical protein
MEKKKENNIGIVLFNLFVSVPRTRLREAAAEQGRRKDSHDCQETQRVL